MRAHRSTPATSQPSPAQVVYIAGYGRSGSTILELFLCTIGQFVGCGELVNLLRRPVGELPPFWSALRSRAESHDRAWALFFELGGCYLRNLPLLRKRWDRYANLWRFILGEVARAYPGRVLVDSSKTTYLSYLRPYCLHLIGCDVAVVELSRGQAGVLQSYRAGSNRDLERGLRRARRFAYLRSGLGRQFALAWARVQRHKIGGVRIDAEHMWATRRSWLAYVASRFPNSAIVDPVGPALEVDFASYIGFSGNRLRRRGRITIDGL